MPNLIFKRYFHSLIAFLCFTSNVSLAQNNFANIGYGTSSYFPRELFFGDTAEVYITGQCNIQGSINNEVSWNGYCYTPLYILGGCSPSLANTFVVGKNGLIRKNSSCEIFGSWSDQYTGTSDTLYSIKFYDINTGVTVGQNGKIFRTENNGKLWTPIVSGNTSSLRNLIIKTDSSLVACGANGTVLSSPDKGITWTQQTTGITTLLTDIDFPVNDTGYAVGRNGVMIKTTDGGQVWNTVSTGVSINLNALDFVDANTGMIVGDDGKIMRTSDGGISWTTYPFSSFYDIFDVKFRTKLVGYFISTFDAYKTLDGGISWHSMGSDLESVKYLDDTTLIAVGDNIVRKSTDGGLSWDAQHPIPGIYWYDLSFPTHDTGYICGNGGKIMKTTDAGQTYTQQTTNAPVSGGNYYFGMHFFDQHNGIAVGSQYMISRTSNGGQTWTTNYSSTSSGYGYYDVFFVTNQLGWVCGSKGTLRKTTDGGATFVNQTSGTQKFLLSVYFLNPLKGFACGESGTLLKTLDGGATWTISNLLSSSSLYGIAFRDSLHGYICADSQFLFETSDGGTTWKYLNNNFTMKGLTFRNAFTGYAVGPGDGRFYFDPIKTFNGYARVCKGSATSFIPKLVSGITIQPGNNFIMEMDTTGDDFTDALFLGALADTASPLYWYYTIPKTLKPGIYKTRVRATACTPVNRSITTDMTVYGEPEADITFRNDTLFTSYDSKYLYQWRLGFTVIAGANKHYYVPSAPGKYTVYVQYGCCYDATASISFVACPGGALLEPQVANNYVLICDSTAATLSVSGANAYHWYNSDTSSVILGSGSTFTTPVLTVRDTFYVASYNNSCESNRVAISVLFTTRPIPPTVSGDSACIGSEALLLSASQYSPHWYADSTSSNLLQVTTAYQIPHLLGTDTFYVSVFNYQCESKRTQVIAYAVESPTAGTFLGDTTVIIGDTVSYFYTPAQGNTFQWFVNGGTIVSLSDSLVVQWDSTTSGSVAVIESNSLGCKTDTIWLAVEVDLGTGLKPFAVEQFTLSPNPASSRLVIYRHSAVKSENLIVYDSKGRIVSTSFFAPGKKELTLDVSKLAVGTYYLTAASEIGKQTKFVVLR